MAVISEAGGYSPVPGQEGCQCRRLGMSLQVGKEPTSLPVTGLWPLPVTSAEAEGDQVLALSSCCFSGSLMLGIRSRLASPAAKVGARAFAEDWPSLVSSQWCPESQGVKGLGGAPARSMK